MSKSAADVGIVGIALGSSAIASVGFAVPFWGIAFALGAHLDVGLIRDTVQVGLPLVGTGMARIGAEFPKLPIIGLFGPDIVAAYVVGVQIRGLMDTPSWVFGLASSSLVGQALGRGNEDDVAAWAQDVLRFAIAVYLVVAVAVFVFAEPIGRIFLNYPAVLPTVIAFITAACLSIVFHGIDGSAKGPLRASGDTRWLFYSQLAGMYLFAIPIAYVGAVMSTGVIALYASVVVEAAVPAAITYYRFWSGVWQVISRDYRPDPSPGD